MLISSKVLNQIKWEWSHISPYIFSIAFYGIVMVKFGSEVRSPRFFGHLLGHLLFAITSSRVHRLGSFFNMMRISSSDTNCDKGVYFCSAVLEKLASKLALGFSPRSSWHHPVHHLEALNFVISSDKISVLNSPSNVDSEYVYFI